MPQTTCAGAASPALPFARGGGALPRAVSGRDAVLDFGCRSRSHSPSSPTTKPERHTILTQASFSAR